MRFGTSLAQVSSRPGFVQVGRSGRSVFARTTHRADTPRLLSYYLIKRWPDELEI